MTQETECLLLAAEVEIARLQNALGELKTTCERHNDPMWRGFANDYDKLTRDEQIKEINFWLNFVSQLVVVK